MRVEALKTGAALALVMAALGAGCGGSSDSEPDPEAEAEFVRQVKQTCDEHQASINRSLNEWRQSRTVTDRQVTAELASGSFKSLIDDVGEIPAPDLQELQAHELVEALEELRAAFRLQVTGLKTMTLGGPGVVRNGQSMVTEGTDSVDPAMTDVTKVAREHGFDGCGFVGPRGG